MEQHDSTPVAPSSSNAVRYRVEHHRPCRTRVLAVLDDARPNRRTLDPFLSRLILEGQTGWAVLVDESTGGVVTRRRIAAPRLGRAA